MIQSKLAAVIDLGTNSIKFIIAEKMPQNTLRTHYEETAEIRIGAGISRSQPSLEDSAMEEVCEAISPFSMRQVFKPLPTASLAMPTPFIPPPIINTSYITYEHHI